VVTDSTSSLGSAESVRAGLFVVPLQVVIDGTSRPEAAEDGDPDAARPSMVARALRAGKRVTTSRPSPEAFQAVYATCAERGADAVVSVHLSGEMSATVDAATRAAQGAPLPVTVVDTRVAAMALGFAALSGARAAAAGAAAEEVAALVRARARVSSTYFLVPSLEHLHRGGRIGAASALLGSALSVKPLLTLAHGRIQPLERVRTTAKARARLEELGVGALTVAAEQHPSVDVAVHHLDDPVGASQLAERFRGRVSADVRVVVSELSAVLGVHVGPGTLGVVVSPGL
jgi:DegV family protein with EDD domain